MYQKYFGVYLINVSIRNAFVKHLLINDNSMLGKLRKVKSTPKMPPLQERATTAMRYVAQMREANDREWTLDEINAEIAASRKECCE